MNCRKVCSMLSAYMDSELTGVEQLQIRRHLQQCVDCSREYEALLRTKRLVTALGFREPTCSLEQRILANLHAESQSGRRPQKGALLDGLVAWMRSLSPAVSQVALGSALATLALLAYAKWNEMTPAALQPDAAINPSAAMVVGPQGLFGMRVSSAPSSMLLPAGYRSRQPRSQYLDSAFRFPIDNSRFSDYWLRPR